MRITKAVPVSVALAILLFILPILGGGCTFINEKVVPRIAAIEPGNPTQTSIVPSVPPSVDVKLPAEFEVLSEVWQALNNNYVDKTKLDPKKLSEGAARGMMESLDPFSSYVDPDTHKLEMSGLEGKFEGIGAVISMKDNQLTVVSPIADSPADKAGI